MNLSFCLYFLFNFLYLSFLPSLLPSFLPSYLCFFNSFSLFLSFSVPFLPLFCSLSQIAHFWILMDKVNLRSDKIWKHFSSISRKWLKSNFIFSHLNCSWHIWGCFSTNIRYKKQKFETQTLKLLKLFLSLTWEGRLFLLPVEHRDYNRVFKISSTILIPPPPTTPKTVP